MRYESYLNGVQILKGDYRAARKIAAKLQKQGKFPEVFGFDYLKPMYRDAQMDYRQSSDGFEFVCIKEELFSVGDGDVTNGYMVKFQREA